jgi:MoxR-like ATPase
MALFFSEDKRHIMAAQDNRLVETITLSQAKALIKTIAHKQSILLLSPPGVGKSDTVLQSAREAGLPCRSLLGTQIAPEDVSGIPRIIGERSVFCPPRILLPERPEPFCLFLDELPACTPDIQKAFYSLLLERRLGEHPLPAGTWVVAAGNRAIDRALVRSLSSALINRVIMLQVRVDLEEWLAWARTHGVRPEIVAFVRAHPDGLMRPVPNDAVPFSTPRAWASLSRALDLSERAGILTPAIRRCLAFGRLTAKDAGAFCAGLEEGEMVDPELDRKLSMSLEELGLSVRAVNCLESEGISTVRQLVVRNENELLEIRNFSEMVLRHVKEKLAEHGLSLGMKLQVAVSEQAEPIPLSQAKALIRCLAHDQSLLFLSPPGVGKSETVAQAAVEARLPCRSLLGTQIAPEDVSGIPRIVGERSVFCPPRILLPEKAEPFCLFLDELPACSPDIQRAFYSLLLERRLGEHELPRGTWVVAAGNRAVDRALVRSLSTALINRVFIVQVRVDLKEWMVWANANGIRSDIRSFVTFMPEALMRPVPPEPIPFSTPRAWASLSQALDLAEQAGLLDPSLRRALAFGRLTPEDAAIYCAMAEESIDGLLPLEDYINQPELLPEEDTARWFVFCQVRTRVKHNELTGISPENINRFLLAVTPEHRFALLVDLVEPWGKLGADPALLETLKEVTGI